MNNKMCNKLVCAALAALFAQIFKKMDPQRPARSMKRGGVRELRTHANRVLALREKRQFGALCVETAE
jgi:hypothetical protein